MRFIRTKQDMIKPRPRLGSRNRLGVKEVSVHVVSGYS